MVAAIPVVVAWWNSRGAAATRLQAVEAAGKEVSFWESWLKTQKLVGEPDELTREAVRKRIELVRNNVLAAIAPAEESRPPRSLGVRVKGLFLLDLRLTLSWRRPFRSLASWIVRFYFLSTCLFVMLSPFIVLSELDYSKLDYSAENLGFTEDQVFLILGVAVYVLAAWGLRKLALRLDRPRPQTQISHSRPAVLPTRQR